jgi:hypothetical protein
MTWHFVNAQTWESESHRVRRVGEYWIAERKTNEFGAGISIGKTFASQELAQGACDRDGYAAATGR